MPADLYTEACASAYRAARAALMDASREQLKAVMDAAYDDCNDAVRTAADDLLDDREITYTVTFGPDSDNSYEFETLEAARGFVPIEIGNAAPGLAYTITRTTTTTEIVAVGTC